MILGSKKIKKQPSEVFLKKMVFLEISQKSQENTCARASPVPETASENTVLIILEDGR